MPDMVNLETLPANLAAERSTHSSCSHTVSDAAVPLPVRPLFLAFNVHLVVSNLASSAFVLQMGGVNNVRCSIYCIVLKNPRMAIY